jgi:hypothetical protein
MPDVFAKCTKEMRVVGEVKTYKKRHALRKVSGAGGGEFGNAQDRA